MHEQHATDKGYFNSTSSIIGRRWPALITLTFVYIVGELGHFLINIVARPMAQDIGYGSMGCLANQDQLNHDTGIKCYEAQNQSSCEDMGSTPASNETICVWDYSGLGLPYQILAGPSFIAIFTISGVFWGMAGDRINRRHIVLFCLTILTISTGLTGFATSYWQLAVLRMVLGAGESAYSPVCSSIISDYFPPARIGFALGIFNWGIYFGYGLSYALGNIVTKANIAGKGWRMSYYICGGLGVVLIFFMLLVVKEPPRKRVTMRQLEGDEYSLDYGSDSKLPDEEAESETKEGPWKGIIVGESGLKKVLLAFLNPVVALLTVAGSIRHTAGYTNAYNTQLYFTTYYPSYNLGIWITAVSIVGGTLGVATGGFVSDKLVKRLGVKARIYVLAASQLIATPFAVGVLYLRPPYAFYSLLTAYIFAEMWLGVLFAVLFEVIPSKIHSTSLAFLLFIINNVGGNAPLLVEPLRNAFTYRIAYLIMYPGMYFISSILFFLSSLLVAQPHKNS